MGAKEFFTAIDMLETYNKIMKSDQNPQPSALPKDARRLSTRELGKYRSYVYREKMLKREILELTQSRLRVEKMLREQNILPEAVAQGDYKRSRSKMIDLWLELSQVMLKRRRLESGCEKISSPFIRRILLHRYFDGADQRLHTWAQTAEELEIPLTGVQLRKTVADALEFAEF